MSNLNEQYNDFSSEFSQITEKANQASIEALHKTIDFSLNNKKVLDIGSGDGSDLLKLQEKGAEVYGIDASEEMIKLAQEKNPKGNFQLGLFDLIPYEGEFFDIVISKYAIQTSEEIEPIFKEVSRVLKSGGIFIYLVVHPFRQFIEKKKEKKDYFKKEIVDSILFQGRLIVHEPTHTMKEYLSDLFFKNFEMISYDEKFDEDAEKINDDVYPAFFIIKARKK